jgi:hypothetical protein
MEVQPQLVRRRKRCSISAGPRLPDLDLWDTGPISNADERAHGPRAFIRTLRNEFLWWPCCRKLHWARGCGARAGKNGPGTTHARSSSCCQPRRQHRVYFAAGGLLIAGAWMRDAGRTVSVMGACFGVGTTVIGGFMLLRGWSEQIPQTACWVGGPLC